MQVLTDRKVKVIVWKEGDQLYYSLGIDDSDYSVLCFCAQSGKYYRNLGCENFVIETVSSFACLFLRSLFEKQSKLHASYATLSCIKRADWLIDSFYNVFFRKHMQVLCLLLIILSDNKIVNNIINFCIILISASEPVRSNTDNRRLPQAR